MDREGLHRMARNKKPRNYAGFKVILDSIGLALGTRGRTRTGTAYATTTST